MFILQNVEYTHPNKDVLFDNISLSINKQDKIALIGNNGVGKSTLLRVMAGELQPSTGSVKADLKPYYVPQIFGQFDHYTVARALRVEAKLNALREILEGNVTEENLELLGDDWQVEERCREALSYWKLGDSDLHRKMETLSGGQKTKVFLAGLTVHQPEIALLDEPSNHLDADSRAMLYEYIRVTPSSLVVVSHDRTLLNLLNTMCELGKHGIAAYGGNYEFYAEQKAIETNALSEDLRSKEKALRKAKETEREALEREQKLDARGRKKQEKAGVPTIALNTLRNNAERSTARMKDVHSAKTGAIYKEVDQLRKSLSDKDKMKMCFDDTSLHSKILVAAKEINYGYDGRLPWPQPLSFQVTSGQRLAISGKNGSGKTTLIKMILGDLQPKQGEIYRAEVKSIYIDQNYALVDNGLTVYEQAQEFNAAHQQEHELKSRLTHFLFKKEFWDKSCAALSGGEKMRLILCCLTLGSGAPDMIILDEPTNNLDIQNLEILTAALDEYRGTIIVVSHDAYFLEGIRIEGVIEVG